MPFTFTGTLLSRQSRSGKAVWWVPACWACMHPMLCHCCVKLWHSSCLCLVAQSARRCSAAWTRTYPWGRARMQFDTMLRSSSRPLSARWSAQQLCSLLLRTSMLVLGGKGFHLCLALCHHTPVRDNFRTAPLYVSTCKVMWAICCRLHHLSAPQTSVVSIQSHAKASSWAYLSWYCEHIYICRIHAVCAYRLHRQSSSSPICGSLTSACAVLCSAAEAPGSTAGSVTRLFTIQFPRNAQPRTGLSQGCTAAL